MLTSYYRKQILNVKARLLKQLSSTFCQTFKVVGCEDSYYSFLGSVHVTSLIIYIYILSFNLPTFFQNDIAGSKESPEMLAETPTGSKQPFWRDLAGCRSPNEEKVGHHLSRGEASKAWILTVWSRYIMNHDIGHWVKTFSSHCHELLKFKVLTAFGHRRMLASAKMQ